MRKKSEFPLVTVVIPVRTVSGYLKECLSHLEKLTWPNVEILVVIDGKVRQQRGNVTFIASGNVGPAIKRDMVIKYGKGEFFAFLDDDAYPQPDWLNQVIPNFSDTQVAAVGGPGVTPPNTLFWEQASGWVSASPVGAGPYTYRFLPGKKQYVDDYPSMNLIVRATDFKKIGGFDSHYYPGEDTKLCLDLIHLGKRIVYEPNAIVFHHRRPLWKAHLKQNGNFGLHRGFFARTLPQTSAKPIYFLPTLLLCTIFVVFMSFVFLPAYSLFFLIPIGFYLFTLLVNAVWIGIHSRDLGQGVISITSVFVTHLWYGMRFVQGLLFTKQLKQ